MDLDISAVVDRCVETAQASLQKSCPDKPVDHLAIAYLASTLLTLSFRNRSEETGLLHLKGRQTD